MQSLFRINSNVTGTAALQAYKQAASSMNRAEQQLASGSRLNKAGDNPTGMAITERFRSAVEGLTRGQKNAQDGISMIQTAEGALSEIQEKLLELRTLTVKAASDALTDFDRQQLHHRSRSIIQEINRIRDMTEYNEMKLLMGGVQELADINGDRWEDLQDGLWGEIQEAIERAAQSGQTQVINVSASIMAEGTETHESTAMAFDVLRQLSPHLTDPRQDLEKAFQWWSDRFEIATGVRFNVDWEDETGDAPPATTASNGTPLVSGTQNNYTEEGYAGQFRFGVDPGVPSRSVTMTAGPPPPSGLNDSMITIGNTVFTPENPHAPWGDDGDPDTESFRFVAKHTVGLALGWPQVAAIPEENTVMDLDFGSHRHAHELTGEVEEAVLQQLFNTRETQLVGDGTGRATFHVGANRDDVITVEFERVDARTLGVWCTDLTTRDRANRSLEQIDQAIEELLTQRGRLGASENRLKKALDFSGNLGANTKMARSKITDTNMAQQISEHTRSSILAGQGANVLRTSQLNIEMALQLI